MLDRCDAKELEALPRLKEGDLEKASRSYKAKTGEGCVGFHTPVVTKETRGDIVQFFERGRAEWTVAATSMHFDVVLDSEEYHERDRSRSCQR